MGVMMSQTKSQMFALILYSAFFHEFVPSYTCTAPLFKTVNVTNDSLEITCDSNWASDVYECSLGVKYPNAKNWEIMTELEKKTWVNYKNYYYKTHCQFTIDLKTLGFYGDGVFQFKAVFPSGQNYVRTNPTSISLEFVPSYTCSDPLFKSLNVTNDSLEITCYIDKVYTAYQCSLEVYKTNERKWETMAELRQQKLRNNANQTGCQFTMYLETLGLYGQGTFYFRSVLSFYSGHPYVTNLRPISIEFVSSFTCQDPVFRTVNVTNDSLEITCYSKYSYQEYGCSLYFQDPISWYLKSATQFELLEKYREKSNPGHDGSFHIMCRFSLSLAKMGRIGERQFIFQTLFHDTVYFSEWTNTVSIKLDYPKANLGKCPRDLNLNSGRPAVKDGYIRSGSEAVCECKLSPQGIPPGEAVWFENETRKLASSGNLLLSVKDEGKTFTCKGMSTFSTLSTERTGVSFTPKFAAGPTQVKTVLELVESNNKDDICPRRRSHDLKVICKVPINGTNPEPRVKLVYHVQNEEPPFKPFEWTSQESTNDKWYYKYFIMDVSDAMYIATCQAENSVFPEIVKVSSNASLNVKVTLVEDPQITISNGTSNVTSGVTVITNTENFSNLSMKNDAESTTPTLNMRVAETSNMAARMPTLYTTLGSDIIILCESSEESPSIASSDYVIHCKGLNGTKRVNNISAVLSDVTMDQDGLECECSVKYSTGCSWNSSSVVLKIIPDVLTESISDKRGSDDNSDVIAGVVSSLVALLLIILFVFLIRWKRNRGTPSIRKRNMEEVSYYASGIVIVDNSDLYNSHRQIEQDRSGASAAELPPSLRDDPSLVVVDNSELYNSHKRMEQDRARSVFEDLPPCLQQDPALVTVDNSELYNSHKRMKQDRARSVFDDLPPCLQQDPTLVIVDNSDLYNSHKRMKQARARSVPEDLPPCLKHDPTLVVVDNSDLYHAARDLRRTEANEAADDKVSDDVFYNQANTYDDKADATYTNYSAVADHRRSNLEN